MYSESIDLELKKIAKSVSIKGMTWEDVWQELRLSYWQAYQKYDPKLSKERTYANRVAKNRIKELIRKEMRDKRGNGLNDVSLDEMLDNGHI